VHQNILFTNYYLSKQQDNINFGFLLGNKSDVRGVMRVSANLQGMITTAKNKNCDSL
jgi:hypothetical protein